MSRSYKKPWLKDRNPFAKKQANKKVRRYKNEISDGKFYRKITNPWRISDWSFFCTWEEYFENQVRDYLQWRWKYEDSYRNKNNWEYKSPYNYKKEHYKKWLRKYRSK